MELIRRFFNTPNESFFLFGPRGTGKSTLMKACLPDALFVDLLDPAIFRDYSATPELFRERLLGAPERTVVVVDEVQKAPQLLSLIHSLLEEKRGWQFILTGSSSRKLKRAGIDLLAGRALLRTLHPFMAAELGHQFALDRALQQGLLPIALAAERPQDVLNAYAALYLREEVQMEGLVRHIGDFSRFLEAMSFSHAELLNISNVARECQVERKVVEGYIGILEDLLLGFRLRVFTKRATRALVVHPKFYYFDAGVYRSLRPSGPLDRPAEIDGDALEGLVAQHLRAWIAYAQSDSELFFWRTRGGVEVDFIVYGADTFVAIEVKNTSRIQSQDLRALKAFKHDYPTSTCYLVYRGHERLQKEDILCIPCEEFLLHLHPDRPLHL